MFFREVVPCVANIEIRGKGKGGNAQTLVTSHIAMFVDHLQSSRLPQTNPTSRWRIRQQKTLNPSNNQTVAQL